MHLKALPSCKNNTLVLYIRITDDNFNTYAYVIYFRSMHLHYACQFFLIVKYLPFICIFEFPQKKLPRCKFWNLIKACNTNWCYFWTPVNLNLRPLVKKLKFFNSRQINEKKKGVTARLWKISLFRLNRYFLKKIRRRWKQTTISLIYFFITTQKIVKVHIGKIKIKHKK